MKRHSQEEGFGLVMLLCITMVLVILAAAVVMVLGNQLASTARDTGTKTSMDYAEAALNSGVAAVRACTSFSTPGFATASQLSSNYYTALGSSAPAPTITVYDNLATINPSIDYDSGGPIYANDPDGKVWVDAKVGSAHVRELVAVTNQSLVSKFPKAALYDGGDAGSSGGTITISGGDVYAVNPDLTPYTSGSPYPSTIMAEGNISATSATNLAAPTSSVQSLGVQANGSVSLPGVAHNGNPTHGGVGTLNSYFSTTDQAKLATSAKACLTPAVQAQFDAAGTVVNASSLQTSAATYNAATDVVINGNLSLSYTKNKTSTFNFKSLYVTGNVTLTGNIVVNATALHVGGTFTITGATTAGLTDQFGPIYAVGNTSWQGTTSVKTTNYTSSAVAPAAIWIGGVFTRGGGAFNDVYGDMFCVFAVNFTPTSGTSSVLCPLLATTEMITTSGNITFGTLAQPMVLYMVCDNDNLWTQTCSWQSVGQFTGMMIFMEAGVNLAPASASSTPTVLGSVMTIGGDGGMKIGANAQVAYDQDVIDTVCGTVTTTTTSVNPVPGTWEQLPASGS